VQAGRVGCFCGNAHREDGFAARERTLLWMPVFFGLGWDGNGDMYVWRVWVIVQSDVVA
jgi:hypothetical protein